MEIVIAGRHTQVPQKFREYAEEKLAKISRYDTRAQMVLVEVVHEANPRQADTAETVEITVRGKGPVVRAEAAAADIFSAFDIAMGKLMQQERRANDRRKSHHKTTRRQVESWDAALMANDPTGAPVSAVDDAGPAPEAATAKPAVPTVDATVVSDNAEAKPSSTVKEHSLAGSPVVIREKVHQAEPMTVEDAIYEMELVGHPFFLFVDKESGLPSVLYHRHGWTYGVLRLETAKVAA